MVKSRQHAMQQQPTDLTPMFRLKIERRSHWKLLLRRHMKISTVMWIRKNSDARVISRKMQIHQILSLWSLSSFSAEIYKRIATRSYQRNILRMIVNQIDRMGKISNTLKGCIWSNWWEKLWIIVRLAQGKVLHPEEQMSESMAEVPIRNSPIKRSRAVEPGLTWSSWLTYP
jgi:hypothetical protein